MKVGLMTVHWQTLYPLPDITHRASIGTRMNVVRQATFLPLFLHSLFVGAIGATTFRHLDPQLWYYWLPSEVDVEVDQLETSSSIAGLLVENLGGRMARFGIEC